VNDRIRFLRELAAAYWRPVLSLAALIPAALKGVREAGFPVPDSGWPLLLCGIGLFAAVRFPRIATTVTRLLLGSPPSPPLPNRPVFRGVRPYERDEALPGRATDVQRCVPAVRSNRFFVLTGESGCGKTSFLQATVLPMLEQDFRVIRSRVTDSPFGEALKRSRVTQRTLFDILAATTAPLESESAGGRPVLLCLDQFEELFVLVRDTNRRALLAALRDAIAEARCHLLVAIREDFLDLLMRGCVEIDPDQRSLTVTRVYTLRPFEVQPARDLLREMLRPMTAEADPLHGETLDDLADALVEELARPPRDHRLSRDDERTVLPVELQIVGVALENHGREAFNATGLRRWGGKTGLLLGYLEGVKRAASWAGRVDSDKAVLVLRQLISSDGVRWRRSPAEVAEALGLSPQGVEECLRVFAEMYLVRLLPGEGGIGLRYELIHDYLVQVLAEVPDPALQRARDVEERLRFWASRDVVAHQPSEAPRLSAPAPNPGVQTETSHDMKQWWLRRQFATIARQSRRWFAQPVPILECIRLSRSTHGGPQRRMLRRSFRGFFVRLMTSLALPALAIGGWWLWTRTDEFQVRTVLAEAPVAEAAQLSELTKASGRRAGNGGQSRYDRPGPDIMCKWGIALAAYGRPQEALDAIRLIADNYDRAIAFATFSRVVKDTFPVFSRAAAVATIAALHSAGTESGTRNKSIFTKVIRELTSAGNIKQAQSAAEIVVQASRKRLGKGLRSDDMWDHTRFLVQVLASTGQVDRARDEMAEIEVDLTKQPQDVIDLKAKAGAMIDITASLYQTGRADEAITAQREAITLIDRLVARTQEDLVHEALVTWSDAGYTDGVQALLKAKPNTSPNHRLSAAVGLSNSGHPKEAGLFAFFSGWFSAIRAPDSHVL
jgi:hypothetical protein